MDESSQPIALVLTTLASEEQARDLSLRLLDERLIACGNIVPGVTSLYRWEGRLEQSGEVLLVMKTRAELVKQLRDRVNELHPYEVPEVVALQASDVAPAYARWVRHETTEVKG